MWNHFAIVGLAASVAVVAAEGLIHWEAAHEPSPPPAASAPMLSQAAAVGAPSAATGYDAEVVKAADGHFWAEANVNGRRVRFLVDTGATDVALTLADAERLGLDVGRMNFDQTVRTAAGEARAAVVELDYVTVAGARVDGVRALVLDKGLSTSLLGMTYLGRLSRFEATQGALILRP